MWRKVGLSISTGLVLSIIAILIAVLALPPSAWISRVLDWSLFLKDLLMTNNTIILLAICLLTILIAFAWAQSRNVVVLKTRSTFWDSNIANIIAKCEKLILVDTYQGHKHEFWNALEDRVSEPTPFHLVYLILKEDDPLLQIATENLGVAPTIVKVDLGMISKLHVARNQSPHKHNKTLEFYYWKGVTPGSLMSWTENGIEKICLALWLNLKESNDLTPYLLVKRGYLFAALKKHYQDLISRAEPI